MRRPIYSSELELAEGGRLHLDVLEDALDRRPVNWDDWPIARPEVHHERNSAAS